MKGGAVAQDGRIEPGDMILQGNRERQKVVKNGKRPLVCGRGKTVRRAVAFVRRCLYNVLFGSSDPLVVFLEASCKHMKRKEFPRYPFVIQNEKVKSLSKRR